MGSMIGSTVLNAALIRWGWNRIAASMITLLTFSCINFLVLKFWNSNVISLSTDKRQESILEKCDKKFKPKASHYWREICETGQSPDFDWKSFPLHSTNSREKKKQH
jgi:hypothetical protein